jgi:hypothetical protein
MLFRKNLMAYQEDERWGGRMMKMEGVKYINLPKWIPMRSYSHGNRGKEGGRGISMKKAVNSLTAFLHA